MFSIELNPITGARSMEPLRVWHANTGCRTEEKKGNTDDCFPITLQENTAVYTSQ